ncbi:hypothetical protein HYH03_003673 [Edaphochlamys debaryana]|uniref:Protein kinase domain-containing protein n=1 Tax=Edaphochlamys debaryana TaxID=47281 RepID=A0A836C352_9CHLO|nr:hypothetical protein HYH03_003673 [Edaphochlamys debaryana]|eukprot:KAG2498415.1 hypothetical protein HYH03_003673 [Edaphochlamys debaryana]
MLRLLVLCALAQLARAVSEDGQTSTLLIRDESQLVKAILDEHITLVILADHLRLTPGEWPVLPIQRRSNFTIQGVNDSLAEQGFPILDLSFLERKVTLAPNVTWLFTKLELRNVRQNAGFEVDLIATSPGATVAYNDIVYHCFSCTPPALLMDLLLKMPLLPQDSGRLQNITETASPWCRSNPLLPGCYAWPRSFLVNWARSRLVAQGFADVNGGGGYVLAGRGVLFVCEDPVTDECGTSVGYDLCVRNKIRQAYDRDDTWLRLQGQVPEPPPAAGAESAGNSTGGGSAAAVAAGAAAGATVAVLLSVAVAFLWVRRRRRRRHGARDAKAEPAQQARHGPEGPTGRPSVGLVVLPEEPSKKGDSGQALERIDPDSTSRLGCFRVSRPSSAHASPVFAATSLSRVTGVSVSGAGGSPALTTCLAGPTSSDSRSSGAAVAVARLLSDALPGPGPLGPGTQGAFSLVGLWVDLLAPLGSGSFGKVYRGTWQGRFVAVKMLQYGSELCHAVHNEVSVSLALRHPNVVIALTFVEVGPGGKVEQRTAPHPATTPQLQLSGSLSRLREGSGSDSSRPTQVLSGPSGVPASKNIRSASGASSPALRVRPEGPVNASAAACAAAANGGGRTLSGRTLSPPAPAAIFRAATISAFAPHVRSADRQRGIARHSARSAAASERPPPQAATQAPSGQDDEAHSAPTPILEGAAVAVHGAGAAAAPAGEAGGEGGGPPQEEGCSHGFLVMELCEGGSAAQWRSGRWKEPGQVPDMVTIVRLALDVACGLAYIHSLGACHGDLKLSNVLLSSSGPTGLQASGAAAGVGSNPSVGGGGGTSHGAPVLRCPGPGQLGSSAGGGGHGSSTSSAGLGTAPPRLLQMCAKLCDFGLSRVLGGDRTHVSTRPHGTASHLAPEVWAEGHVSQQSDMYAFGITLWELATGERPWRGVAAGTVLHRVMLGSSRPPLPLWLPPDYAKLMVDCWAQAPHDRPSAAAVEARLRRMLLTEVSDRATSGRAVSGLRAVGSGGPAGAAGGSGGQAGGGHGGKAVGGSGGRAQI